MGLRGLARAHQYCGFSLGLVLVVGYSDERSVYGVPCQDSEVVGDDGGPDVGMEAFLPPPVASIQAKASFEGGDAAFDAGPEVFELSEDPRAFDHVAYLQASFFMEADVL